jgi:phage terminase small subunit
MSVTGQQVFPDMVDELGFDVQKLKHKHERFCHEYVYRSSNATKAYKAVYPEVGYNTAKSKGYELLQRPDIIQRIREIRFDLHNQMQAEIINYHRRVMTVDRLEYLNDQGQMKCRHELSEDAAAIIEFKQVSTKDGIRTLIELPTRHQSAVEIAKITGMHTERLELTGREGGAVEISDIDNIERAARIAAILNSARGRATEPTI